MCPACYAIDGVAFDLCVRPPWGEAGGGGGGTTLKSGFSRGCDVVDSRKNSSVHFKPQLIGIVGCAQVCTQFVLSSVWSLIHPLGMSVQ